MSKKQNHIEQQPELNSEIQEMISGSRIAWDKSKDEVWSGMLEKMENSNSGKSRVIYIQLKRFAAAAILILLIGIPTIMMMYSKTIKNPSGQHAELFLPDGSQVTINAQSTLSYKPLLWKFSRTIKFEGEAFFKVQPGKKFEVTSKNGTTIVMGTSFTVYSRDNNYEVTCITGKVKVLEIKGKEEVVLNHGQKAELSRNGKLEVQSDINAEQSVLWIKNKFSFTSVPLNKVFNEISRQYNIKISLSGEMDNIYTGSFTKSTSVENVLNLVCRPFNLKYLRKSDNEYIISREN